MIVLKGNNCIVLHIFLFLYVKIKFYIMENLQNCHTWLLGNLEIYFIVFLSFITLENDNEIYSLHASSNPSILKPTTGTLLPLPVLTQIWILTKPYLLWANGPDPLLQHLSVWSAAVKWTFLSWFKKRKLWSTPGGYRRIKKKDPWKFYLVAFFLITNSNPSNTPV